MAGGSLADDGGSQDSVALVEHRLLNDLVRPQQQRLWDRQVESFDGLEVDHQFELGRSTGSPPGLRTLQNLIDVGPEQLYPTN